MSRRTTPTSLRVFFVLAFACAWLLWSIAIAVEGSPTQILITLGSFAPAIAATALVVRDRGRPGVRELFGSLVQWRFPLALYALIVLGPCLVAVAAIRLGQALGEHQLEPASFELTPLTVAVVFVISLIFGGPLGEEIGWRGYALPRLRSTLPPLRASLVLGVLWAIWHLPLFIIATTAQHGLPILLFMLLVIALSVCFTGLYEASRGSLLAAVLLHASVNVSAGLAGALAPQAPTTVAIYVGLTVLVASALAIRMIAQGSPELIGRAGAREVVGDRDGHVG